MLDRLSHCPLLTTAAFGTDEGVRNGPETRRTRVVAGAIVGPTSFAVRR